MPNGELSLQHVCMWTDHGWQRVTTEIAIERSKGRTIHAKSELLKCELCGQNVTFVCGKKYRPYFKHSRGEDDKNCPERTLVSSEMERSKLLQTIQNIHPIRLVVQKMNAFQLEIGLFPIAAKTLNKIKQHSFSLIAEDGSKNTYLFERMNNEGITYFPVNHPLSSNYTLTVDKDIEEWLRMWIKQIPGTGDHALFHVNGGKMVQPLSEVVMGKEYYLLSEKKVFSRENAVMVNELKTYGRVNLYSVKAYQYNQKAAEFFLDLHYFLTDAPVQYAVLWPPVVQTGDIIQFRNTFLYFLVNGNGTCEMYPMRNNSKYCIGSSTLSRVFLGNLQQILYVSKNSHLLTYSYLKKDTNSYSYDLASKDMQVFDENGIIIQSGDLVTKIPKELKFTPKYDGKVEIYENGYLVNVTEFKADRSQCISQLIRGSEYQIYVGNDCTWSLKIKEKHEKYNLGISDGDLIQKLKKTKGGKMTINHSFGSIIQEMNDYPLTKCWIRKCIAEGSITKEAYSILIGLKGEGHVK